MPHSLQASIPKLRLLSHIDALKAERDGLKESAAVDLELLAQFMIQHSFATGHGESIAAMLGELDWQIRELRDHTEWRPDKGKHRSCCLGVVGLAR